mmetsp:Transcript_56035/g.174089  ORF Transcript_56035/g.174089 Transcript_56035/m.174089 type:complete len:649 (+) Transcript_56035:46-1992(+)
MDLYPTQEAKHQPGRTRQSCTAGNTHGLVNPASMPTASKPASLRTPPGHAPVFLRELVQLLRHSLLLVRGHGGDGLLVHLLLALVDLDGHAVVVPHALVHLRVVGVLDLRLDEVPRQLLLRLVPALRVVPARSSLVGQPAGLQEPEDVVLILLAHVPPAGAVHVCAGGSGNDLCVREAARERIAMRHADLFTEAFEQGVEAGLVAGIAQGLVQQVVARARHLLIEVVLLFLLLLLKPTTHAKRWLIKVVVLATFPALAAARGRRRRQCRTRRACGGSPDGLRTRGFTGLLLPLALRPARQPQLLGVQEATGNGCHRRLHTRELLAAVDLQGGPFRGGPVRGLMCNVLHSLARGLVCGLGRGVARSSAALAAPEPGAVGETASAALPEGSAVVLRRGPLLTSASNGGVAPSPHGVRPAAGTTVLHGLSAACRRNSPVSVIAAPPLPAAAVTAAARVVGGLCAPARIAASLPPAAALPPALQGAIGVLQVEGLRKPRTGSAPRRLPHQQSSELFGRRVQRAEGPGKTTQVLIVKVLYLEGRLPRHCAHQAPMPEAQGGKRPSKSGQVLGIKLVELLDGLRRKRRHQRLVWARQRREGPSHVDHVGGSQLLGLPRQLPGKPLHQAGALQAQRSEAEDNLHELFASKLPRPC